MGIGGDKCFESSYGGDSDGACEREIVLRIFSDGGRNKGRPVGIRTLFAVRVEGDDLLIFSLRFGCIVAVAPLPGDAEHRSHVFGVLGISRSKRLERVLTPQDLFQSGLEILGWGRIAAEPVDLRPVATKDKRGRRCLDRKSLEGFCADFRVDVGQEKDEILVEERMELDVLVKLLTQQSATPSATAEEIDEYELILALCLGHGLIQRSLEPGLSRSGRGEDESEDQSEPFFHDKLLPVM